MSAEYQLKRQSVGRECESPISRFRISIAKEFQICSAPGRGRNRNAIAAEPDVVELDSALAFRDRRRRPIWSVYEIEFDWYVRCGRVTLDSDGCMKDLWWVYFNRQI